MYSAGVIKIFMFLTSNEQRLIIFAKNSFITDSSVKINLSVNFSFLDFDCAFVVRTNDF